MNLCKFRNKCERIVCEIVCPGSKGYPEEEVGIFDILFWIIFAMCFVLLIGWWLVPLRYVLRPLSRMRFRCDKNS